jgi:hypothetical protein
LVAAEQASWACTAQASAEDVVIPSMEPTPAQQNMQPEETGMITHHNNAAHLKFVYQCIPQLQWVGSQDGLQIRVGFPSQQGQSHILYIQGDNPA